MDVDLASLQIELSILASSAQEDFKKELNLIVLRSLKLRIT